MNLIKQAVIYKFDRKQKLLIYNLSKVKMGLSVASYPFVWLDVNVKDDVLVRVILDALDESRDNLPDPEDWNSFNKEFLKSAGLKKPSDLYNNSVKVSILREGDTISFMPTRNNGSKGFVNIVPAKKGEVKVDAGVEKIALALEKALDSCE